MTLNIVLPRLVCTRPITIRKSTAFSLVVLVVLNERGYYPRGRTNTLFSYGCYYGHDFENVKKVSQAQDIAFIYRDLLLNEVIHEHLSRPSMSYLVSILMKGITNYCRKVPVFVRTCHEIDLFTW